MAVTTPPPMGTAPAPGHLALGSRGVGTALTSALAAPTQFAAVTDTSYSSNWSGLGGTGAGIRGAEGHWTVPSVQGSAVAGYSSSWVGVDGLAARDTDLIQAGTEQDTSGGYYAWWEILPHAAVRIVASHGRPAPVEPDDRITVVIHQTATSGRWTIYLRDLTRHWYFQQDVTYSGPGRSAEWIEEAPVVKADQTPLPDFGSVTFSGTAIYGRFGAGLGWYSTNLTPANEIVLRNRDSTVTLAQPSAPTVASPLGQRFSDRYVPPARTSLLRPER